MRLIDDVLESLRLQSTVFCRMTLRGDWGFAKDALSGAPFHLMLSGRACLMHDGLDEPLHLEAGDVVVLPRGEKHRFAARPNAPLVPFRQVADAMGLEPWAPATRFKAVDLSFGSGAPETTLISGVFAFGDHRRNPLLGALPSVLLMRGSDDTEVARSAAAVAGLLDAELLSGRAGAETIGGRLADILFVQIVRHHLTSEEMPPRGWLRGVADPEIGPALAIMHRAPEKQWSVATLACERGMSRSRFAARFQEVVGQAPLEYLTEWRMYQAAGRLGEGKVALPHLAASVGYRSDVAFSKAFKRWAGRSPAEYRRWLTVRTEVQEPALRA
jgi:AraC-like DNA-binding protein